MLYTTINIFIFRYQSILFEILKDKLLIHDFTRNDYNNGNPECRRLYINNYFHLHNWIHFIRSHAPWVIHVGVTMLSYNDRKSFLNNIWILVRLLVLLCNMCLSAFAYIKQSCPHTCIYNVYVYIYICAKTYMCNISVYNFYNT